MAESFRESVQRQYAELRAEGLASLDAIAKIAEQSGRSTELVRRAVGDDFVFDEHWLSNSVSLGKVALGFGVAVAGFAVAAFVSSSRPEATELQLSSYESQCKGGDRYEGNCEGKFIIWNGEVDSVADDYVRVRFAETLAMDVWAEPETSLVEGQRVQASGYLADKNFIYPDIEDGEVIAMEDAGAVSQRIAEAESDLERRRDAYYNSQWSKFVETCQAVSQDFDESRNACENMARSNGIVEPEYPFMNN